MVVQQNNPTGNVPFYVAQNSGDFHGAQGAMPTVMLSKNGGAPVKAFGAIIDAGNGLYWLTGDARDRDVAGEVVMLVTAPSGDIAPPAAYVVQAPSFWSLSALMPANIASIANNIRLLAKYTVPAQAQGEIQ